MKNSIRKNSAHSVKNVKCDFCSHGEGFTVKKYKDHLDEKHRDVSIAKKKKSISRIIKRILYAQQKIQILNPEVQKYLLAIDSKIEKHFNKSQMRELYGQDSLINLNYCLVNILPSKGKDELRNLGIDIYRNDDLDRRFSETGKYKYWVTVFSARM